jgi:putative transposase
VVRQCELLDLARSTAYYEPLPLPEADLVLMRRLDELHLKWPFLGARRLRDLLDKDGFEVGRKHVTTLMRKMGIAAIYRKPRTSTPGNGPEHRVYPYLLRKLAIEQANHVWTADITYRMPSQRSPPRWGPSCLSMSGMHCSAESMLQ